MLSKLVVMAHEAWRYSLTYRQPFPQNRRQLDDDDNGKNSPGHNDDKGFHTTTTPVDSCLSTTLEHWNFEIRPYHSYTKRFRELQD